MTVLSVVAAYRRAPQRGEWGTCGDNARVLHALTYVTEVIEGANFGVEVSSSC